MCRKFFLLFYILPFAYIIYPSEVKADELLSPDTAFLLLSEGKEINSSQILPYQIQSTKSNHFQNNSKETIQKPSFLSNFFILGISLFQKYISPVDGPRCTLYPTCSAYAVNAIKTHGLTIGLLLSFDRIMHETDEHLLSREVFIGKTLYYEDSLERNTFWWKK